MFCELNFRSFVEVDVPFHILFDHLLLFKFLIFGNKLMILFFVAQHVLFKADIVLF